MVPITVAYGDGIGPEIMQAALFVLEQAGANLELETIEIGERVYQRGFSAGIEPSAWESLRRTRVFYKAPITTPQGGGFKSLNVTIRKTLGLYANVRPVISLHPYVDTFYPDIDVVIIRENEEDLYAGIEHRQTAEVYQTLKLVSRPGTEKIIRYAFEYARRNARKKVTCFTKDNIMKMTDGLFHQVFDEIAARYPEIENEHLIIDIGAAKLADTPQKFDVIVVPNLYGDIISDVAAQITGSVGLGGSANVGEGVAMFEAIHGSAPDIAGQGIANPSGLLLAGVMMLVHIGLPEAASAIHNAWMRTIEDGVHTRDIYVQGISRQLAGTMEFAEAVVARLGQIPQKFTPVKYAAAEPFVTLQPEPIIVKKDLVGVDVFLDWNEAGRDPAQLAAILKAHADGDGLELVMITNRGITVWPGGYPETFCTDHWRCRFMPPDGGIISHAQIVSLLDRVYRAGLDFIKTENLCQFDGEIGFSLGQGQNLSVATV